MTGCVTGLERVRQGNVWIGKAVLDRVWYGMVGFSRVRFADQWLGALVLGLLWWR